MFSSKPSRLRSIPAFLLPFKQPIHVRHNTSSSELRAKGKKIWVPSPTKFCPNVKTFLSLIGRNMIEYAPKFSDWSKLFSMSSRELKRLGIDRPRSRRYLLRWREKFRQRRYGIGGDFKYISKDGIAELHVAEVSKDPKVDELGVSVPRHGTRKIVVNAPVGVTSLANVPKEKLVPVKGYRVRGAHTILGPYALPMKGGCRVAVPRQDGMWEDIRGRKIDGGERRQAEVRAKKRGEEKRAAR